jgi:hypothetical protein
LNGNRGIRAHYEPGEEWDRFADQQTDIPFFASSRGEVLREGLGGQLAYAVLRDNGSIAGGMPGVALKVFGFRLYYSIIPYGGYIGEKRYVPHLLDAFSRQVKGIDVAYVFPPPQSSIGPTHNALSHKTRPSPELISPLTIWVLWRPNSSDR